MKTTRVSRAIPGVGCPLESVGEGATAVPRVSLTVKRRNREPLALPSVLMSSHDGLATSSHQACAGISSTGSLRDVDAVCRGFGVGLI